MEKKNVVFLTVLAVATLLTAVVGTTFAYFTATVTGDTPAENTITTATLSVDYTDGNAINSTLIVPGTVIPSKTITVTNNSTVNVTYAINWVDLTNDFVADVRPAGCSDTTITTEADCVSPATWTAATPENNFVYTAVATSSEKAGYTGAAITADSTFTAAAADFAATATAEKVMPTTEGTAFVSGIVIKPNEVHTYVITPQFKEAGYPQDGNQGKTFHGKLQTVVSQTVA